MSYNILWLGRENLYIHIQVADSTPADQVVSLTLSLHEAQKLGPNLSMDTLLVAR
jgi:hypothetical protein